MKHYFNNQKAKQELVPLFEEARRESGLEYGYFEQGDLYTALKIRDSYYGFIMVNLPVFQDAEIVYSFVTKRARRKGHYTELLKGTRKEVINKLNGTPYNILVNEPKIPYLHEARGAFRAVGGKWLYELRAIQRSEKRLIDARPDIQKTNRSKPNFERVKAEACKVLADAPWQGGGWGYNPHQYTRRRDWTDKEKFFEMVEFLQNYGERVKYGREYYDVVYFDTHRVWNCSLIEHPFEVNIINRKPIGAR